MPNHKLGFDHAYMKSRSGQVVRSLEKRGFTICPKKTLHFGILDSQFILFKTRNSFGGKTLYQYLEFSRITNMAKYRKHVSGDQQTVPSKQDLFKPGFALRTSIRLESMFRKLKRSYQKYGLLFVHYSYKGRNRTTTKDPGWRFCLFETDPIPPLSIWLIENDRSHQNKPRTASVTRHKNGTQGIVGFVWTTPLNIQKSFFEPFGSGQQKVRHLDDGTKIWTKPPHQVASLYDGVASKETEFLAIVLECESMDRFRQVAKPDHIFHIKGAEVAVIRTETWAWDLWVIEKSVSPGFSI